MRKKHIYTTKKFKSKPKFIKNPIKTYRLKYKLNKLKNTFLIHRTRDQKNKNIDLFFKETNYTLLFIYLISIVASQKLKK